MNKRNPSGFTIVEIILFFAVSVALMLGIITGVGASISRQRYNDTVNDVAEYIRSVYTEVQSVSNNEFFTPGTAGRTEKAIYGKLLTFSANADGSTKITSQTIVGVAVSQSFTNFSLLDENPAAAATCTSGADVLTQLGCVRGSADSGGNTSTYTPVWSGSLEKTNNNQTFTDCILVVRSPLNGAIHTYTKSSCGSLPSYISPKDNSDPSAYVSYFNGFSTEEINICIDSEDNPNKRRRNLRITADAATSSGVILPALNSTTTGDPNGSACGNGNVNTDKNASGNKPS